MKPDWKDSPPWARYLACNAQGFWNWYELKPEVKQYGYLILAGRTEIASYPEEGWENSMEARPE